MAQGKAPTSNDQRQNRAAITNSVHGVAGNHQAQGRNQKTDWTPWGRKVYVWS